MSGVPPIRLAPFQSREGGITFETKGVREYLDGEKLEITATGRVSVEPCVDPRSTRLLYPGHPPHTPGRIRCSAVDGSDTLGIVFTPKAVCEVVAASIKQNMRSPKIGPDEKSWKHS